MVRFFGVAAFVLSTLAGCASAPGPVESTPPPPAPLTALSEARAMVDEARAAGYAVEAAEQFLRQAEQANAADNEEQTITLSDKAKQSVVARKAIETARPVVTAAVQKAGALASDAAKLLDAAEVALKAGDPLRASELAGQATRQAEEAVARLAWEEANGYRVTPGDSLWAIAGKANVYADPLQWPLLFRSNRTRIEDPDLILPGQSLAIGRDYSAAEKEAAVRHARERGAWQVGTIEAADQAYLSR